MTGPMPTVPVPKAPASTGCTTVVAPPAPRGHDAQVLVLAGLCLVVLVVLTLWVWTVER